MVGEGGGANNKIETSLLPFWFCTACPGTSVVIFRVLAVNEICVPDLLKC